MASSFLLQTAPTARGAYTGHVVKTHSQRISPCCAERRRYYRGSPGRFPEDVNSVMDVIADVMAGAESIYTASKRARDDSQMENAASRPETVVWPAQNDATTTANTQADSRPQDSVYSNSRSDVEEEVVQLYHPVDIEEDEEGYSLFMDVPGLQKSDIKVQVLPKERMITISGERTRESKPATADNGRQYRRRYERRLGKFKRTLKLAKDLDIQTISARVDCGVLHVTAMKMAQEEPEAMQINID